MDWWEVFKSMVWVLPTFRFLTVAAALTLLGVSLAIWWVVLTTHRAVTVGSNSIKECTYSYMEAETPGHHLREALIQKDLQSTLGACLQALVVVMFVLILALFPFAVPLGRDLLRKCKVVPGFKCAPPECVQKSNWYVAWTLVWFGVLFYSLDTFRIGMPPSGALQEFTPYVNQHQFDANADMNAMFKRQLYFTSACAVLMVLLQVALYKDAPGAPGVGAFAWIWIAARLVLLGMLIFGGVFAFDIIGRNERYIQKLNAVCAALRALPERPVLSYLLTNYYAMHPTRLHKGDEAAPDALDMKKMLGDNAAGAYTLHAQGRELHELAGAHPVQVKAFQAAMAELRTHHEEVRAAAQTRALQATGVGVFALFIPIAVLYSMVGDIFG